MMKGQSPNQNSWAGGCPTGITTDPIMQISRKIGCSETTWVVGENSSGLDGDMLSTICIHYWKQFLIRFIIQGIVIRFFKYLYYGELVGLSPPALLENQLNSIEAAIMIQPFWMTLVIPFLGTLLAVYRELSCQVSISRKELLNPQDLPSGVCKWKLP